MLANCQPANGVQSVSQATTSSAAARLRPPPSQPLTPVTFSPYMPYPCFNPYLPFPAGPVISPLTLPYPRPGQIMPPLAMPFPGLIPPLPFPGFPYHGGMPAMQYQGPGPTPPAADQHNMANVPPPLRVMAELATTRRDLDAPAPCMDPRVLRGRMMHEQHGDEPDPLHRSNLLNQHNTSLHPVPRSHPASTSPTLTTAFLDHSNRSGVMRFDSNHGRAQLPGSQDVLELAEVQHSRELEEARDLRPRKTPRLASASARTLTHAQQHASQPPIQPQAFPDDETSSCPTTQTVTRTAIGTHRLSTRSSAVGPPGNIRSQRAAGNHTVSKLHVSCLTHS